MKISSNLGNDLTFSVFPFTFPPPYLQKVCVPTSYGYGLKPNGERERENVGGKISLSVYQQYWGWDLISTQDNALILLKR